MEQPPHHHHRRHHHHHHHLSHHCHHHHQHMLLHPCNSSLNPHHSHHHVILHHCCAHHNPITNPKPALPLSLPNTPPFPASSTSIHTQILHDDEANKLEDEEDEELIFVMTDEWRDFFAKSDARRREGDILKKNVQIFKKLKSSRKDKERARNNPR
ncbi:hypothetical protein KSS87_009242 [Heliosperma pusillum]|nr:hypothetical protein KSS87_009242 [Heliosperma pusillum]